MKDLLEFLKESVTKGSRKYPYKGSSIVDLATSMDFNQFHELFKEHSGLKDLKPAQAKKLVELCESPLEDDTARQFRKFDGCMFFDQDADAAYFVVADHLVILSYDEYKFFDYGTITDLNDIENYTDLNDDQILKFLSEHTQIQYLF